MDVQVQAEIGLSLNHVPGWLRVAATTPALMSMALGWLPASVRASVPSFVVVVSGALTALGWLALVVCVARAVRWHWQDHEPAYAALDAWKVIVYWGALYYWAEGQLFPSLPAIGPAFAVFMIRLFITMLVVPIVFGWYSRRFQHRTAPYPTE
jgi:hypothetical protein